MDFLINLWTFLLLLTCYFMLFIGLKNNWTGILSFNVHSLQFSGWKDLKFYIIRIKFYRFGLIRLYHLSSNLFAWTAQVIENKKVQLTTNNSNSIAGRSWIQWQALYQHIFRKLIEIIVVIFGDYGLVDIADVALLIYVWITCSFLEVSFNSIKWLFINDVNVFEFCDITSPILIVLLE